MLVRNLQRKKCLPTMAKIVRKHWQATRRTGTPNRNCHDLHVLSASFQPRARSPSPLSTRCHRAPSFRRLLCRSGHVLPSGLNLSGPFPQYFIS